MANLPTDVAPFAVLPVIDRIPSDTAAPSALNRFVDRGSRRWGGVPIAMPTGLTVSLWLLLAANAGLTSWLMAVEARTMSCSGIPCAVATWGGHTRLLLVLAAACVFALAAAAAVTRCLTRTTAAQSALIALGGVCGTAAISGSVVLLMIALGLVLVGLAAIVAILERA